MKQEPSFVEILLAKLIFLFRGESVYRAFADRLPLDGGEQALDFGCGMGAIAYYAAKRLPCGHLTCLDRSARWLKVCRQTLRQYENVSFLPTGSESPLPPQESFDVAYCHFVLHDLPESELNRVIPALAQSIKPGGALVYREPLKETKKLGAIKRLIEQNGLFLKDSRITDIPLMGNALESVYRKTE